MLFKRKKGAKYEAKPTDKINALKIKTLKRNRSENRSEKGNNCPFFVPKIKTDLTTTNQKKVFIHMEKFTTKQTHSLLTIIGVSAVTALAVAWAANNVKAVRNVTR